MTSFDRENSRIGILSQAVGEDTASSTRADDDIVVLADTLEILCGDFANFGSRRCQESGVGFARDVAAPASVRYYP
jgi:hypothetical protein